MGKLKAGITWMLPVLVCLLAEIGKCESDPDLEPFEFKPMRWNLGNIILMAVGLALILAIIGTFALLGIIKPKHGTTVFNDDGSINKAATQLTQRQSKAAKKGLQQPDSFDLIVEDELKNRAGKLRRPKSSMARKNIFKKSLKIHQHLPEMSEKERKITKSQLKKESKKFKRKNSSNRTKGDPYNSNSLNV